MHLMDNLTSIISHSIYSPSQIIKINKKITINIKTTINVKTAINIMISIYKINN